MITSKDVHGRPADQTLDKLMTRRPMTVTMNTPVASAAHRMVTEGLELLPVTDRQRKLLGTIGRSEVLRAMQLEGRPEQLGETFDALMWSGFSERRDEEGKLHFTGAVTPQMSGPIGTVSEGVLAALMQQAAARAVEDLRKQEHVLENMTAYYLRTVPIEAVIDIQPTVIDASRRFVKLEVQVTMDGELIAKSVMTAHSIDPA